MRKFNWLILGFACLGFSFGFGQDKPDAKKPEPPKNCDLTDLLGKPDLWSLSKDDLEKALKEGPFKWTSADKTEYRAGNTPMTYQKMTVLETIFRFQGPKFSEVFLSIFNRGDTKEISENDFNALVVQVQQMLQAQSGVEGSDVENTDSSSKYLNQSKIWVAPQVSYRLESAYSKVGVDADTGKILARPEYVNLTIMPGGLSPEEAAGQRKGDLTFVEFDKRVKHESNGDVWIDSIPMVDQGVKGYCVVATMERILRYYGSQVSEHELAERADSSGTKGTNTAEMAKVMRSLCSSLDLNFSEYRKTDPGDFMKLIDDYNRAAKPLGKDVIDLSAMQPVTLEAVLKAMSPEVLRELKLKNPDRINSFFTYISTTIDKGWPLAWSVLLGWVEEKPSIKGAYGGHMRMLIGYNPETQEVLYSDSWGAGHELKRMSVNDAFLMSQNMYVVEPKL